MMRRLRPPGTGVDAPLWLIAGLMTVVGIVIGCSEDKNPIAFDQGPRGPYSIRPETLLVRSPVADIEMRPDVSSGVALSIFVGSDSLAETRGYVRFESIPDTTTIRRAYLRLFLKPGRGEPISIGVREVLGGKASWSASEIRFDNAPPSAPEPLDRVVDVPTEAVDPDTPFQLADLEIPISLVRRWAEFPDSNGGLEIFSDGGRGIARIVANNDVITNTSGLRIAAPALIMATDTTRTQIRIGSASADAYVIRDLRAEPTGSDPSAALGSAPAARALFRFDLTGLPPEISIVRATLSLHVRAGQFSTEDPLYLTAYEITSDWTEDASPESLTVASSAMDGRSFDDEESDTVDLELGSGVQSWIDGASVNRGILVRMGDEISRLRGLTFSTREDPDSLDRPSLRIVYVRTPDYRW